MGEVIDGVSTVYTRDQPTLVTQAEAARLAQIGVCDLPGHCRVWVPETLP